MRLKYWITIGVLIIVLPLTIIVLFKDNQAQKNIITKRAENSQQTIPSIAEQPTDTLVANGRLPIHNWKNNNDSQVYFVPTEQLPIVDIKVSFDAGTARDGNNKGLANLVALGLAEGNKQLNADQLAQALSNIGANYSVFVDQDMITLHLRSLSYPKQIQQATEILSEIIASPTFPTENINRLKQQVLVSISKQKQNPGKIATMQFYRTIYNDHPYSNTAEGNIDSIQNIKTSNLFAFHQRYFVAKNAVISIVGGIHRDTVKEIANHITSKIPTGNLPEELPEVQPLHISMEKRISFASKQTHIFIGQPGRTVDDEDLFPLLIGNHILGGKNSSSRLFSKIREEQGLAYAVNSSFKGLRKPGPFYVQLQTKTEQADDTINMLKEIISDFVTNGPTQNELTSAKQYLSGSFPLKFSSNSKIINFINDIAFYQLPVDFLDRYIDSIQKVDIASIKSTFQRRLEPEQMAVVIVGETTQ
jgi:zinc protease